MLKTYLNNRDMERETIAHSYLQYVILPQYEKRIVEGSQICMKDAGLLCKLGDNTFVIEWFAGINWIILWSQISFYRDASTILIHSDKTRFQNVFVTLLRHVTKDVTSSLLSWHKRYDFMPANFRRHSQWKCALQT